MDNLFVFYLTSWMKNIYFIEKVKYYFDIVSNTTIKLLSG